MDRWLLAAGVATGFAVLGAPARELAPKRIVAATASAEGPASLGAVGCPEGTAPDGDACVHLDGADEAPFAPARANSHHERSGHLSRYDQIPRLPDRPADYDLYRYPIPPPANGGHSVMSGYDLDLPDEKQRRGSTLKHVGHGGVDLPQARGTPVALVPLEHQEGDAEVVYVGPLFGTTVLTKHTVREEGGRTRDYLVLFGHLDSIAAGLSPGRSVREGEVVGTVGDSGSRGLVHLHLEIRRLRDEVDLSRVAAGASMIADNVSVVCDPRNVLPLK